MYLQEKHKQFAVKSYAKFTTNNQVAQAFIEKFPCRSVVSLSILPHPSYPYLPFIRTEKPLPMIVMCCRINPFCAFRVLRDSDRKIDN